MAGWISLWHIRLSFTSRGLSILCLRGGGWWYGERDPCTEVQSLWHCISLNHAFEDALFCWTISVSVILCAFLHFVKLNADSCWVSLSSHAVNNSKVFSSYSMQSLLKAQFKVTSSSRWLTMDVDVALGGRHTYGGRLSIEAEPSVEDECLVNNTIWRYYFMLKWSVSWRSIAHSLLRASRPWYPDVEALGGRQLVSTCTEGSFHLFKYLCELMHSFGINVHETNQCL